MKKIFFRRTLVFVSTIILILIAFIMFSTNTLAEDPPEDPNNGWYVEGSGTYFEINNSTYLNISLTSSETVIVILESVPRIVSYHIQSNCTAQSTLITLSGFIPGLTYYLHQDGNLTDHTVILRISPLIITYLSKRLPHPFIYIHGVYLLPLHQFQRLAMNII
jgi:hypothetical protein